MIDLKLTKNFYLSEFTANSHSFDIIANDIEIDRLKRICQSILQPLRDEFNIPIKISSGLRSSGLNSVVNGSSNSRHLYGLASDFQVEDPHKLVEMFEWIIRYCNFHSVIYYNTNFLSSRFIHVSIEEGFGIKPEKRIVIKESGKFYPLDAWLKLAFSVI